MEAIDDTELGEWIDKQSEENKSYILKHEVQHFCKANKIAKAALWLTDYGFLDRKLKMYSSSMVIDDFEAIITAIFESTTMLESAQDRLSKSLAKVLHSVVLGCHDLKTCCQKESFEVLSALSLEDLGIVVSASLKAQ